MAVKPETVTVTVILPSFAGTSVACPTAELAAPLANVPSEVMMAVLLPAGKLAWVGAGAQAQNPIAVNTAKLELTEIFRKFIPSSLYNEHEITVLQINKCLKPKVIAEQLMLEKLQVNYVGC